MSIGRYEIISKRAQFVLFGIGIVFVGLLLYFTGYQPALLVQTGLADRLKQLHIQNERHPVLKTEHSGNFDFEFTTPGDLDHSVPQYWDFLKEGDSLFKNKGSDTLFVFRGAKMYRWILAQ
jgi:hypothetical protein